MRIAKYLALLLVCASCTQQPNIDVSAQIDPLAEQFVRLALSLGEHDEHYVDAYFGPEKWREHAHENPRSLDDIAATGASLAAEVRAIDVSQEEYLVALRQDFIASHLESLSAIARMRSGEEMTFDEESKAVY